jgi:streptomycin 6-kinase
VLGENEIVVPAELAELHAKYSGEDGRAWIAGLPTLAACARASRDASSQGCRSSHSGPDTTSDSAGAGQRRPPALDQLRCPFPGVDHTLDGSGEWKAIDPKPLGGDSGFELLPALWNRGDDLVRTGDLQRTLLRRFDLMTDVLGVERSRAAGWTLGRVLQVAVWDLVRFGESHVYPSAPHDRRGAPAGARLTALV